MSNFYNRHRPFLSSIVQRYPLSKNGSKKNTQHVVLNLKGSGIQYEVGDSIGVIPQYDEELVRKTIQSLRANGNERIICKHSQESISFADYLRRKANITGISPKLLRAITDRLKDAKKKSELEELQKESNRESCKAFLQKHEVWDFLQSYPEVFFEPQEFADLLMPLLPRFYSISSSQKCVGEEVHLTVAPTQYETNGHIRRGVCTHYLCHIADLHDPVVPIFIQPTHAFQLPQDPHVPLVMIGPGTGIAPFRAFLQERFYHHESQGKHWLFFGEWNREHDFFYEEEWMQFKGKGNLRIDLAFSRDQEKKIYVQHKMRESGEELFKWLQEGAYLYVCGDAQRMAKDVELVLQDILKEFGGMDFVAARDYLKQLRHQKRYLRDVY